MSDAFIRMHGDHVAMLCDALGDVELTDNEHRVVVRWLAGMDRPTVEAFAAVFRKARQVRS